MPFGFAKENFDVCFLEMMFRVRRVLHDGGFEGARCGLGGREMLSILRGSRPGRFSHIAIGAGCVVGPCACVIIYNTVNVIFFQFVLRVDKMFAEQTSLTVVVTPACLRWRARVLVIPA